MCLSKGYRKQGEQTMSKETTRPQEAKEPRTVKLSSVAISLGVLIAIIASFIAGWHLSQAHTDQVQAEATVLVNKLSKTNQ